MADNKGTSSDAGQGASPGKYFLLREAECSDDSSEDGGDLEELFDRDTDSETGGFIDDTTVDQGTSAELYHQQETQECDRQLQVLKRKFLNSPQHSTPQRPTVEEAELALSPILKECRITPKKGKTAKKKIRFADQIENEAEDNAPAVAVEPQVDSGYEGRPEPEGGSSSTSQAATEEEPSGSGTGAESDILVVRENRPKYKSIEERERDFDPMFFVKTLMKSSNYRARVLFHANNGFGVAMSELTRVYKSNKTLSSDWVVCSVGVREDMAAAAHEQFKTYCDFVLTKVGWSDETPLVLQLLRFKHQKNRECVLKLFRTHMLVDDIQVASNPPRTTSTAAALYWYQSVHSNCTTVHGPLLDWILNQTEVAHKLKAEAPFELSYMVQWAFDNDYMTESEIALNYALMADEDKNALAFLKSNSQARIVKDCATMVRLYKRGEMNQMNMAEWIQHRSNKVDGENPQGWRNVLRFLRHQNVEIIPFLTSLKYFLHGTPKKNCICIQGPPDTGKSFFAMSLIRFLDGKVVTFANSKSHFWLQPLADAKIGLIDDCTEPFWTYCDTYLRNGLDGNQVCIDLKHRAPMQLTFPPMLLTSNIYIDKEPKYAYLKSRIKILTFPTVIQRIEGTALHLKDEHWKSFFVKFKTHLELETSDDESEDGPTHSTLRVSSRRDI
ncbi:E1 [Miniopterus schreibersii papillomavirus 1]|uniref:Replication protein E1 n=1 Tax=Miniopterus schreibersii papillomavirus 1 TaxID=1195364 RepID=J9QY83_9PAPI|nr:E1 [Miniopterus schreibersii papillomavirus 1]AFR33945.1 E1 [Miniopterus schreibersii papillomavirus 1]